MDRDLYNAARSGDVSFLGKEDIKTRNLLSQLTPTGSSVLHLAAESDQLEFFQEAARLCSPLLVKQANSKGETSLHSAVTGCGTEVVDFIIKQAKEIFSDIEQGHDVIGYKEFLRMENTDGDNALHLAARHNLKSDVAKLLLEADPELSTVANSKSHQSACFLALLKNNHDVADVLLSSRNPSCSLRGQIKGMTALHLATIGSLYRFDLMGKLVEAAPGMITQVDYIGWTPLHYAASLGRQELVKLFVKKDKLAAYKLELQDGQSALHLAAIGGKVDSMAALIEACPDCADLVDNKGRNALHAAVLSIQIGAVKFLLSLPSTLLCVADQDGNTPLGLAILRKDYKLSTALTEKVAEALRGGNSFLDKEFHAVYLDIQDNQQKATQLVKNALTMDTNNGASSGKGEGAELVDYNYYQLSATLIATVTFTAAFTIPGGFIQSGDKDAGMAVLISRKAFQTFVIFDVLTFFASLSILILLQYYRLATDAFKITLPLYLGFCYHGMAIALGFGLYVVLGNNSGFSRMVFVLSLIGAFGAMFCSAYILYQDIKKKYHHVQSRRSSKIKFDACIC